MIHVTQLYFGTRELDLKGHCCFVEGTQTENLHIYDDLNSEILTE